MSHYISLSPFIYMLIGIFFTEYVPIYDIADNVKLNAVNLQSLRNKCSINRDSDAPPSIIYCDETNIDP